MQQSSRLSYIPLLRLFDLEILPCYCINHLYSSWRSQWLMPSQFYTCLFTLINAVVTGSQVALLVTSQLFYSSVARCTPWLWTREMLWRLVFYLRASTDAFIANAKHFKRSNQRLFEKLKTISGGVEKNRYFIKYNGICMHFSHFSPFVFVLMWQILAF